MPFPSPPPDRRRLGVTIAVALIAVATVIGVLAYWPTGEGPDLSESTGGLTYVEATVQAVEMVPCEDQAELVATECQSVTVDVTSGPLAPTTATFLSSLINFRIPVLEPGDEVVLGYAELGPPEFRYTFLEYQRDAPLLILGVAFAAVVIAFGRWKGVRALAGLAISLTVVIAFLLPSLLRDNSPVGVALVATSLIAFAALYLAHGVSMATTTALLGTLASVVLITALAAVFTGAAALTGLSDDSVQVLRVTAEAVDPRGILIAGMVIGALGVLDDVTVTQVSAVGELRRANPAMPRRELYRAAIRIGRDHVASTVNTLVLAYVGASLALMLFFLQEGRGLSQLLGREVVAIEIVRTLVGSIGLVASVPLTTALAVALGIDSSGHGHSHGPIPTPPEAGPPGARADAPTPGADGPGRDQGTAPTSGPRWDDFAPEDEPGF